ncbi:D-methionine transport system substrate-binding protein [Arcanobacterium pluranimalium]|uniref:MetQ/NlpA family ABC transporter substrate-binding protein n=1 Tax=Arcanobacterium pluranimalium TaxID=108028 RepID=UPI00195E9699|nr:MetQ/NlpA family ABC transporter substrate-binding protein [Arcanobacterium pluranimalium]MBM7825250.1 D-methionine transport system substrate-binding protein [Arcanobacterium pluranimalium]
MRNFKKIALIGAVAALALGACSSTEAKDTAGKDGDGVVTLTVGASPVPHADILRFIDEKLAKEAGIDLEIKEYTDYVQPNVALDAGELNANFFQHVPYFDAEVKEKGYKFEHGNGVHIEPYALFSKKYKRIDDIPNGARILVNNDPSNQARALQLLEQKGLIKLKESKNPTLLDIISSPINAKVVESEAPAIPVQLPDADAAVINGNFALEAGLVPSKDALAIESGENNPYANVLAWNKDSKKAEAIAKLEKLLHSPEVAKFIKEKYPNGEIIPAF